MPSRGDLLFRAAVRLAAARKPATAPCHPSRKLSNAVPPNVASVEGSDGANFGENNHGRNRNLRNLSLLGPPGSGKGSYGKHFAKALGVPLVTASDVLRKLRPDLAEVMADGKLVDDEVVGDVLLEGLTGLPPPPRAGPSSSESNENNSIHCKGYILDGFPRTLKQVLLMEDTWPESLRVGTVVHLSVPDFVCEAKLLGRRACSKCGRSYNVHGVDRGGWSMPPHLPAKGQVCESTRSSPPSLSPLSPGDVSCDWSVRRDDDTPEIVGERLRVYHQNADPILDYIRGTNRTSGSHGIDNNNNGNDINNSKRSNNDNKNTTTTKKRRYHLLTLKPYRGFDDLPGLVDALHKHVDGNVDLGPGDATLNCRYAS